MRSTNAYLGAGSATHLSQRLSSVLSNSDVATYDPNDLMMPSLDPTMTCIDDGDAHSWKNDTDLTYNTEIDNRAQSNTFSGRRPRHPDRAADETEQPGHRR